MGRIRVFSGTTEGRLLSLLLSGQKIRHIVCVATQYGSDIMDRDEYADVRIGRMDAEQMALFLKDNHFGEGDIVADATHPYAVKASQNIRQAADVAGCKYIRVLRDLDEKSGSGVLEDSEVSGKTGDPEVSGGTVDHADAGDSGDLGKDCAPVRSYPSLKDCMAYLNSSDSKSIGRILLTTGTKELDEYCSGIGEDLLKQTCVRVLPSVESIEACVRNGISRSNIIAMQGPFSYELNRAVMSSYGIRTLITKNSGRNGGYYEKLKAASDLGISVHVIERSVKEEGLSVMEAFSEIAAGTVKDDGLRVAEASGEMTGRNALKMMGDSEGMRRNCGHIDETKSLGRKGDSRQGRIIYLCGYGMGSSLQVTGAVKDAINKADAVFGSKRLLAEIEKKYKYTRYLSKDIIPILEDNIQGKRYNKCKDSVIPEE